MPQKIRNITHQEDQGNPDPAYKYALQFNLVPDRFQQSINKETEVKFNPNPIELEETEKEVVIAAALIAEETQKPALEEVRKPVLEDDTTISPFTKWLISKKIDPLVKVVPSKVKSTEAKKAIKKPPKKEGRGKKESNLTKNKPPKAQMGQSILLSTEIISETLAEVLYNQGHTKAAKEMYEKLSLKYPEKSIYFANLIKKTKK